ncbi:winged helix-turn-helix domain-containing protein [Nocardioides oleivorans]|uniref:Winged helix-turn-helix domain-containing protein n=1 Tax=Nocardioides oleivorans TaxID=273676 RepID=A0A4Q2RYE8_9ACTN|nr:crosslink repair DNA glycosylase YcaQ family protein [Nocardioides oleivorans]RYB93024.1 winged helix-turn-helix domain-containing protein [Nocardioides oleivorans]
MDQLTQLQARRIALAAQGFTDRAHADPSMRTFERTLERTGVLQVDSVNVLQRAHYMPLYSRMGPYDTDLLRRAAQPPGSRPRRVVEYWAHVQALMPVDLWPVMQHRMDHYRSERGKWGFTADAGLEPRVLDAVRDRGPVTARDLEDELSTGPRTREHWGWNWSEARKVLDYLYLVGDVAIAGRTSQFEVLYDLPERVLPAAVLAAPTPTPQEAVTELVRRAARSHGVGSGPDLADYYRLRLQPAPGRASAKVAIEELVEAGELVPVTVQGWKRQAYLHRDARLPRRVGARTLLSPFDPVVWERARAEALFDFFYRIEIYVPAEKRLHGYYVLPFLLGDRLVARVDLKADRARGVLLVPGAFVEAGAPPETAEELAAELWRLAGWLGLDDVVVGAHGDLVQALGQALGR